MSARRNVMYNTCPDKPKTASLIAKTSLDLFAGKQKEKNKESQDKDDAC